MSLGGGRDEAKKGAKQWKGNLHLTTHSTHFIYGDMTLAIWLRTIQITGVEAAATSWPTLSSTVLFGDRYLHNEILLLNVCFLFLVSPYPFIHSFIHSFCFKLLFFFFYFTLL